MPSRPTLALLVGAAAALAPAAGPAAGLAAQPVTRPDLLAQAGASPALIAQAGASPALMAVTPLQDHVGAPDAATAVDRALRGVLASGYRTVDPTRLRDALRAGRLRDVDAATPDELARLAAATGAELLLSTTLHFAALAQPPRVTLSARLYRLGDGQPLRTAFVSLSGLDRRGLLGLGVVTDFDVLARRAAERLADDLGTAPGPEGSPGGLPKVALVPLGSVTERAGTTAAAAATEAVRAELGRRGIGVVSPGLVTAALRTQDRFVWGGVDETVRGLLAERTDARYVLTGSVEAYDVAGSGTEPDPSVALALRLLDVETGRIVWVGGDERTGWDQIGLFRLGRIYTRGELARRMTEKLIARLLEEHADPRQSGNRQSASFRTESDRP